jgi:Lantibiotic dehydratase, N terminus
MKSDTSYFSWQAGSPLAVRIAGLPASALAGLEFEALSAVAEAVSLDEQLAAEGEALSDALFEVIGGLVRSPLRSALVGLRRAVHQVRRPAKGEWNELVAKALPDTLATRVDTWAAGLETRRALRRELPARLAEETECKLAKLREISSEPAFRRALSQASHSLSDELEKWLVNAGRRPQRQKVIRLAKYVVRAASKTSPYSTFAVSGFATWGWDEPAIRYMEKEQAEGVLELDGEYLRAVKGALARLPELASATLVKINPSARTVADAVEFIGHPPREPIVSLQATPGVRACLRLIGELPGITVAGLRSGLAEAAVTGELDTARRFLDRLAATGLLEFYAPVPDHAPEPIGELLRWVQASSGTALPEVIGLLGAIQAELTHRIPVDEVAAHRARQAALQRSMAELALHVRLPAAIAGTASQPAVHEAGVARRNVAACSARRWRPALNDLDVVRRWLSVFDFKLPVRIVVAAFCRERFGPRATVPFGEVYRAVQDQIADGWEHRLTDAQADLRALFRSHEPWSIKLANRSLPRLRALDELRREARAAALQAAGAAGDLHVEPDTIAKVVRNWPDWIMVPSSSACYVQALEAGDSLELVLNLVHGGHGRGRSRLSYLTSLAGGTPSPLTPVVAGPGDRKAAELGGLLGSTLNVRIPSAPYEIDYPFSVSARPADQRLPLSDLLVVHDPVTDRVELVSDRWGTKVMPLHLGMMANFQLPPAARFLEQVFGAAYLMHPVAPVLIPTEDFSLPEDIERYPRVSIGHVVIQRARWVVKGARIPRRSGAEDTVGYLMRLTGWMRQNGVPPRSFVRIGSGGFRGEDPKSRKPVYLDQANLFSMLDFEHQANASEFVIFEEAIPDPLDAAHSGDSKAHVAEFMIELIDGVDDDE